MIRNWKDRLKLVDASLDKLCNLNDEAFNMILPSLVLLFSHEPIRIQALRLFPKLGQRLGEEETKNHLLKPIVSLFESSRPSIPKILFESYIIEQFLRRFGITNFLQQLFPLYLEALTIDERIRATISPQEVEGVAKYMPDYTFSPKSNFDIGIGYIPSVTQLANSAFVDICFLIGPILTSKYIMKQVYKLLLKEYSSLHSLIESISVIGKQFGETFTYLQYTQAITVIQMNNSPPNTRNTIIISNHLALLEKLTPQLSSSKIFTEFESGFADALNKILEWNETGVLKSSASVTRQNIKNKLSMHLKTMHYLFHVSNNVGKEDWERYVAPILQKYFASFGMSPENPSHNNEINDMSVLEEERDRQMVFAYSQFCIIVGQETMRRIIPISDAIESIMYDQFNSNDTLPLRETSPLSIEFQTNGRSPDNSLSPPSSGGGNFSSKDGLNGDETTKISSKKISKESNSGSHVHRARSLFMKESGRKSPESIDGKHNPKSMSIGSVANMSPSLSSSSNSEKNWTRYLSTNSEEMSNSLQFTFNDLKLRTYLGHTSAIRGIGINENSRIIASGSRDRTVKIWSLDIHHGIENSANLPYSECLMTYSGHRKTGVGDVYFVGGGGNLGLYDIVASCDGLIHLWVPESGQTLHQFSNNRTQFLSIRPIFRSRYLLGGLSDNTLTFLDTVNHVSLHTWKCSTGFAGTIRAISVNTSETLIAVGFTSGIISLIDTRTGMMIGSWKAGDTDIIHVSNLVTKNRSPCVVY
ncbi:9487_t:CDS:10 [Ambispora leptoticha]|uniref:9487_t:CDS:1 n=1 Tax=Ambispora leptoticha TaxID=144679 RepID=A0A9N8WLC4_9GLOM|nr:9487_t:CDS:10 [Ambispora leptoticha]